MKRILIATLSICLFSIPSITDEKKLTDDEIRQVLIQQSISHYPGNCPCPYNRASNGSMCGKRSAYSKPGGYSPLCYPSDVSDGMVETFRKQVTR
ncbi:hypothetical protein [Kordiimonas pumila]|uniref:Thyroglobulin type-1 domain-containing protein n=1 Tax=Kordiimonas pumila TaxID=2161677 RepID=A0ABV7D8V3_9PROT